MKHIILTLALVGLLISFAAHPRAAQPVRTGETPLRVRVFPSNPNPGDTVSIEVELTGTVSANQAVAISGTPGFWSSLPSSVTVLQGNSTVTFSGTIDPYTQTGGSVTASCNGGQAGATITL